ncbi:uncharacterized protein LOC119736169 [Patiria miniata]|uniref:N-acetyltransferase domain-containing protein n=1 Tax=Patiria miniata TaxID=46514 RepID=A0A914AQ05_PATMI|nr:uncharacterized protein LOC119736169 [Patiria miniata]XP_038066120.1 uncharacterized protein LOC119736169 [Patiria miniata]
MALLYTWKPLHSIRYLIPSCVSILRAEYPNCKADLLPELAKHELNPAPCSYGLVEHPDDKRDEETLVGHVRFLPVTNRQGAVYAEGFCIDVEKRRNGIGELGTLRVEYLAREQGYKELFLSTYPRCKEVFIKRSWSIFKEPLHTLGANLLHTNTSVNGGPIFVSWPGNTLYPGWEWVYEGGVMATEADLAGEFSGIVLVKYLKR